MPINHTNIVYTAHVESKLLDVPEESQNIPKHIYNNTEKNVQREDKTKDLSHRGTRRRCARRISRNKKQDMFEYFGGVFNLYKTAKIVNAQIPSFKEEETKEMQERRERENQRTIDNWKYLRQVKSLSEL